MSIKSNEILFTDTLGLATFRPDPVQIDGRARSGSRVLLSAVFFWYCWLAVILP
jgi:hypothetical protein